MSRCTHSPVCHILLLRPAAKQDGLPQNNCKWLFVQHLQGPMPAIKVNPCSTSGKSEEVL